MSPSALVLCLLMGCPAAPDTAEPPDTDTGSDSSTAPPRPQWTAAPIADQDGGLQLRLAVAPGDELVAAWFANTPVDDGLCTEIASNPPPRLRYPLLVATGGPDAWTPVEVARPVVALTPTGVDLRIAPSGQPAVAYTGGTPQGQYCGGNDAILATWDGTAWVEQVVATESNQSNTGLPASDAGFVVGHWPALAYDLDGHPAILHRDVHYGALQRDDEMRADAELAWSPGGSWQHEAVDASQGAGAYSQLRFASDGQPVAVYVIPVQAASEPRLGVWAAKRQADGTWERVQLHAGAVHQEVAVDLSPEGVLSVAYYSADDLEPRLRRLTDLSQLADPSAWSDERVGVALYDEGRHIALTRLDSEHLALAYHRCKRAANGGNGCDPNDEALVVALESASGWEHEVAYAGQVGDCGLYASIAATADSLFVGFQCTESTDAGFVRRPWLAQRPR